MIIMQISGGQHSEVMLGWVNCHCQSPFGPLSLGILLQKLLSVQARFWPFLTVFGPNDLEGQGQISPFQCSANAAPWGLGPQIIANGPT